MSSWLKVLAFCAWIVFHRVLHDDNTHVKGVQVTFQISKPEARQSIRGLHSHDARLVLLSKISQPMKTPSFVIQAIRLIDLSCHHRPLVVHRESG
jgi:hypothetical protein